ncbi:hypothetical protein BdWA1_003007 [Babesia duncani]|uniref:RAP domain-containing protein n=1 Tax=Babesia duncani TaxID=323732 RepID=A0AAD9PIZ8_9APIC|nr:hypothetical protein BdWA1_003007 [Babesia duncani]
MFACRNAHKFVKNGPEYTNWHSPEMSIFTKINNRTNALISHPNLGLTLAQGTCYATFPNQCYHCSNDRKQTVATQTEPQRLYGVDLKGLAMSLDKLVHANGAFEMHNVNAIQSRMIHLLDQLDTGNVDIVCNALLNARKLLKDKLKRDAIGNVTHGVLMQLVGTRQIQNLSIGSIATLLELCNEVGILPKPKELRLVYKTIYKALQNTESIKCKIQIFRALLCLQGHLEQANCAGSIALKNASSSRGAPNYILKILARSICQDNCVETLEAVADCFGVFNSDPSPFLCLIQEHASKVSTSTALLILEGLAEWRERPKTTLQDLIHRIEEPMESESALGALVCLYKFNIHHGPIISQAISEIDKVQNVPLLCKTAMSLAFFDKVEACKGILDRLLRFTCIFTLEDWHHFNVAQALVYGSIDQTSHVGDSIPTSKIEARILSTITTVGYKVYSKVQMGPFQIDVAEKVEMQQPPGPLNTLRDPTHDAQLAKRLVKSGIFVLVAPDFKSSFHNQTNAPHHNRLDRTFEQVGPTTTIDTIYWGDFVVVLKFLRRLGCRVAIVDPSRFQALDRCMQREHVSQLLLDAI